MAHRPRRLLREEARLWSEAGNRSDQGTADRRHCRLVLSGAQELCNEERRLAQPWLESSLARSLLNQDLWSLLPTYQRPPNAGREDVAGTRWAREETRDRPPVPDFPLLRRSGLGDNVAPACTQRRRGEATEPCVKLAPH